MTTQDIINIVAHVHGLKPEQLQVSAGRKTENVRARNHAMYLIRRHKGYVQDKIAAQFGYLGKSRSTGAFHGISMHDKEFRNNIFVKRCHELANNIIEDFNRERGRMELNPCSYLVRVA